MGGDWRRFVMVFVLTAAVALLAAAAAIALIDPLGISPLRIVSDRIVPQADRRFVIPAIVRGGRYDGYIVGTSTVHTLDPVLVERVLPGRFANVALLASSPYEQSRLVALIGRESRGGGHIVWGMDANWCAGNADQPGAGSQVLPDWLYDESRWNDIPNAFNWSVLDMARRKLSQALGWSRARLREDGYDNMLPPDPSYDAGAARKRIYGDAPPRRVPVALPPEPAPPSRPDARFPGVRLLRETLGRLPPSVRVVVVMMPAHASIIPAPDSSEAETLERCKAALAAVAAERGDWLLDGMWRSAWTTEDGNYWDPTHFRDHLAEALIRDVGSLVRGSDAQAGSGVRVIARGRWGRAAAP